MARTSALDRVIAQMRLDLAAKQAEVVVLEKTLAYLERERETVQQRKATAS